MYFVHFLTYSHPSDLFSNKTLITILYKWSTIITTGHYKRIPSGQLETLSISE